MFRTEVHIPASGLNLSLQDGIVTMGSCFAEVIGGKLRQNKAQVLVNPFGTIFNPISVGKLLRAAAGETPTFADNLVQHKGVWYAYDLHSSLSSPSREQLLTTLQDQLDSTHAALQKARLLIITLGTAVGYRLQSSGAIVANCHKLPARQFSRELLSLQVMLPDMERTLRLLHDLNPNLHVLLTVSPVRHIKETIEMNSVSKALLRVLCNDLVQQHPQTHYFPAFEVMMDDLRDYRFYGRDMVHPTEVAEDYIWDKFAQAYLSDEFQLFIHEWEKIRRALAHRPFHPESAAHQAFLRNTLSQLQTLADRYGIDKTPEARVLEQQLTP